MSSAAKAEAHGAGRALSTDSAPLALTWRRRLPAERRRRSLLRGSWCFARSASVLVALFLGTLVAPAWWLRLGCAAGLPFAIGALFVIGHDAAHQSGSPAAPSTPRRSGACWPRAGTRSGK